MRTVKCAAFVVIMIFAFLLSTSLFCGPSQAGSDPKASADGIVVVGNKICPVMGEKVSGKHSVVYNGKKYSLCCNKCVLQFERDPDKYAAIADKEVSKK